MWKLLFGGADKIIGSIGGLVKTIFGDREAKDRYIHEQEMSVQDSYQAEFMAPEKKHWFNILVDGLNRLVRPLFTYSIVAMFIWAAVDPVEFTYYIQAIAIVPADMWIIIGTIILFWFGGRLIEKGTFSGKGMKIDPVAAKTVIDAYKQRQYEKENTIVDVEKNTEMKQDDYIKEMNDSTKPLSNQAILEWNRRNKKS